MTRDIRGKVILITGASSGIGEAIARSLAKEGAKVLLGARRETRLESLAKQIRASKGEVEYAVTDVRKRDDLNNLVELALHKFGKLDVLINNAGISQLSRIDELDVEAWEDMIDINIKGVLYGIASAMPVFKKQGYGHIVNIISTSGIKIVPLQGVYAGTKNAIRTISEALRQESNGKYRVTGISPGFVKTEFISNLKDPEMRKAGQQTMDEIGISPNAVADAVMYAISQPDNINVGDIVIRPTVQG
ncbi:NADP-dependent 3-hydroxy acid dehydrogenase YdfG [Pedobacter sp. UYP30]|uniref:SDR family oxidoreductase n=1 Tax=Pedobacter sp. UYP30 TaxID=1756400 RepID=UPI00339A27EC